MSPPSRPQPPWGQSFPSPTPAVTIHVHHASRNAWLVLSGSPTSPGRLKSLVRGLRRAHARIPEDVDAIGIDLSELGHLTIDLAVLLCLENRVPCLRGRTLVAVVRGEGTASPGAERVFDALPIFRADDERSAGMAGSLTSARSGGLGWETVRFRRTGSFATSAA